MNIQVRDTPNPAQLLSFPKKSQNSRLPTKAVPLPRDWNGAQQFRNEPDGGQQTLLALPAGSGKNPTEITPSHFGGRLRLPPIVCPTAPAYTLHTHERSTSAGSPAALNCPYPPTDDCIRISTAPSTSSTGLTLIEEFNQVHNETEYQCINSSSILGLPHSQS